MKVGFLHVAGATVRRRPLLPSAFTQLTPTAVGQAAREPCYVLVEMHRRVATRQARFSAAMAFGIVLVVPNAVKNYEDRDFARRTCWSIEEHSELSVYGW